VDWNQVTLSSLHFMKILFIALNKILYLTRSWNNEQYLTHLMGQTCRKWILVSDKSTVKWEEECNHIIFCQLNPALTLGGKNECVKHTWHRWNWYNSSLKGRTSFLIFLFLAESWTDALLLFLCGVLSLAPVTVLDVSAPTAVEGFSEYSARERAIACIL